MYKTYYQKHQSCNMWRELQLLCSITLVVLASITLILASPAFLVETVRETLDAIHTSDYFDLAHAGPIPAPLLRQAMLGVGQ